MVNTEARYNQGHDLLPINSHQNVSDHDWVQTKYYLT